MRYNLNTVNYANTYVTASFDTVTDTGTGFLQLMGYSRDEIINKSIPEVFVNLLRLPQVKMEQLISSGKVECFLFTKALESRELKISCKRRNTGETIYSFKEKPHSRLEEKFPYINQLCIDNVNGIAVFTADDFILLKANQQYLDFLDVYNRNPENSIGRSEYEITTGFRDSEVEALCKSISETGKTAYIKEFMFTGFDRGITYWDTTIVPIIQEGKAKYLIHNASESTERVLNKKHLESQIKITEQQKEHIKHIIENISDGLCLISKDGDYSFLNQAGKDFFYNPDSIARHGDSFYHTRYFDAQGREMKVENMVGPRVFNGEMIKDLRITAERPDGTMHFSLSGSPIYDSDGSISSAIISCREITKQIEADRLTNQQKEQLEAMVKNQQELKLQNEKDKNRALVHEIEMKDEFLTLISHEFKTPLTVINSAVQAMELICRNELSDKAKGFLEKIRQNSNRQMKLVNNLLDITRIKAGSFKINIKDMDIVLLTKSITESIIVYSEQKGIILSFSSTLARKVIGIDDEKYERILLNLLSNAIKFTPEGKSVTVKVFQKTVKGKCKVCIQVKDNGIGIPEDKQEFIFERFGQVDSSLTRQAEGSGIGLSLVKMLVEMLDGEITLNSMAGRGSTFTILLPAVKSKKAPIEQTRHELYGSRLIQAKAIEFSDIYVK